MKRVCEFCGRAFEAQRSTRKTCSERCRARLNTRKRRIAAIGAAGGHDVVSGAEGALGALAVAVLSVPHLAPGRPSPLVDVTERALSEASRLDTVTGPIAMMIATRMGQDSMLDNAAGLVALSKELDRLLGIALKGAEPPDELDELEERRRRKAARAGN
jgi:hypothetical protein